MPLPLPLGVVVGKGRDLADAGTHLVAGVVRRHLGGTLREHLGAGRSGRIDGNAGHVAIDVLIDSGLAGLDEAAVDGDLTLWVDDLAGVVVESRCAVESVLADRGLDRAGIEIAETRADTRVGLGWIPATTLALIA